MASDSHTFSATASDEPLENKMNVEAQANGKETASSHEQTSALVRHNLPSHSTSSAMKDKQINQPPAADATTSPVDSQIESPNVLEPPADNTAESQPEEQEATEKGQDEHDENTEQVEPKEAAPVKDSIDIPRKDIKEVVEASDGKEEKYSVESVALEVQELSSIESAEKMHPKTVGVSRSPEVATGKQAELVEIHPVKDGSVESAEDESKDTEAVPTKVKSKTTEAENPEVETKLEVQPEVPGQAETAYAAVNKSVSEVEIQQKEQPETTGKADSSRGSEVEPITKPDDRTVETQNSVICSKDEKSSDQQKSSSTESPEKVLLSNQDVVSELKMKTEEASSPSELIEKVIGEEKEKHVVEEPPTDSAVEAKDNKENVSEDKDVITKGKPEEGENIQKITEAAADEKCTETAREIDTEPEEKENARDKPAELGMEKIAAVVPNKKPVENKNVEKYTEPAADDKCAETAREIDPESKDKENAAAKPGELAEGKVAKAAETAPEVTKTETSTTESSEQKQQPAVTTKEVAVKPKHSNNIISKVKQSFVKAKKAIAGKSPSSKTLSTKAKEEIKVK